MQKTQKYSLVDYGVIKHEGVFKNGLKVTFIEKPFAPIYAEISIGAGSLQNPNDNGLAHFCEHVIVSGSKKYPKKELLASIINNVGGYSNASTSLREMRVLCKIADKIHLPQMEEHFQEVLGGIYVTDTLIEKEKGVISSEIKKKISNNSFYNAGLYLSKKYAPNTPWSYSTLGTIESISSFTLKDIEDFFEENCTVENMKLTVSGGCSFSDIEKTFENIGFLTSGNLKDVPADPNVLLPEQRFFYQQKSEETKVGVFFKGPKIYSRESVVLHYALNHAHIGIDSRFYKKIRNEKGLSYSVSKIEKFFDNMQYIGTEVGTLPEKASLLLETILECYKELLDEGMTATQIKDRNSRFYYSCKRSLETSEDWVNKLRDLRPKSKDLIGDYPDIHNVYQTITPEEIDAVLRAYITPDNFHLYVLGEEPINSYS